MKIESKLLSGIPIFKLFFVKLDEDGHYLRYNIIFKSGLKLILFARNIFDETYLNYNFFVDLVSNVDDNSICDFDDEGKNLIRRRIMNYFEHHPSAIEYLERADILQGKIKQLSIFIDKNSNLI